MNIDIYYCKPFNKLLKGVKLIVSLMPGFRIVRLLEGIAE